MKLFIQNRKNFLQNFLAPITAINSICSLNIKNDVVESICCSCNDVLSLHVRTKCTSDAERKIFLPDVGKLNKALGCVMVDNIDLSITENNIKYNDGEFKFTYHLLVDGVAKKPSINFDKVRALQYDTTFEVSESMISTSYKGMSFAPDIEKMYIYTEDGKVKCEIGDKAKSNIDSFTSVYANTYQGKDIEPLPIKIETFKWISFFKGVNSIWQINQQYGVVKVDLSVNGVDLTYIFSALAK